MSNDAQIKAIMDCASEVGEVFVVSRGTPCHCGPGFCASNAGVGFAGYCGGPRKENAPDCQKCGAPHQSPSGCWACGTRDGNNVEMGRRAVRSLKLGVSWLTMFEQERITGKTLDEQLDEMERAATQQPSEPGWDTPRK